MYDRIKELAIQAGLISGEYNGFDSTTLNIAQKNFAELIVRECIGIVEDAVLHREPASTYVSKIKQHFGVEE